MGGKCIPQTRQGLPSAARDGSWYLTRASDFEPGRHICRRKTSVSQKKTRTNAMRRRSSAQQTPRKHQETYDSGSVRIFKWPSVCGASLEVRVAKWGSNVASFLSRLSACNFITRRRSSRRRWSPVLISPHLRGRAVRLFLVSHGWKAWPDEYCPLFATFFINWSNRSPRPSSLRVRCQ